IKIRSGRCSAASKNASPPVPVSSVRKPAKRKTSRASFTFFSLSSTIRTSSSAIALHRILDPLGDGQREAEGAAGAGPALDPQVTAVQLDELARQRQPEARTLVALAASAGLPELLED